MHVLHLILVCFRELHFGKAWLVDCHFKRESNIKTQHLQNNTSIQLKCLWRRWVMRRNRKLSCDSVHPEPSSTFGIVRVCFLLGIWMEKGSMKVYPQMELAVYAGGSFVFHLSRRFLWPAFSGWYVFPVTCFLQFELIFWG